MLYTGAKWSLYILALVIAVSQTGHLIASLFLALLYAGLAHSVLWSIRNTRLFWWPPKDAPYYVSVEADRGEITVRVRETGEVVNDHRSWRSGRWVRHPRTILDARIYRFEARWLTWRMNTRKTKNKALNTWLKKTDTTT